MRLQTRLLVTLGLILALVGGALLIALPRVTERAILRYTAGLLAADAEALAKRPALLRAALDTEDGPAAGLRNVVVVDGGDRVVRAFPATPVFQPGRRLPGPVARLADRARSSGAGAGAPVGASGIVAAAVPVGGRGPGWVMILFQPVRDLDPAIRQVKRAVLAWTLAGLLLALLMAALTGGALARRLGALSRAARAMADGRLDARVPVEGGDEVADVARSFNLMADRLQKTISDLRRSEDLRRDFMASLAHDLRTPVTSIGGFAEALRDGVVRDPDQQRRYAGIIVTEARRLGRLVQDLFDYARLQAGQLEFRMQPLDVRRWFEDFCDAARARVEGAGFTFEASMPADDVTVLADGDRLARALTNLVDNALRYAPAGSRVALEASVRGDEVRFSVADEGPGVPEEERERIWDRFYRGRQAGSRAGEDAGSGLGLAIVKSIVEAHGGRVGVDAGGGNGSPPRGSRFWFALPRRS
ncbi:MAG: HAMP domain-containing histidine kinase [Clostridia bacterium]|nr:HAMP domain-containing histidine kinase [Clostridia bacterium]